MAALTALPPTCLPGVPSLRPPSPSASPRVVVSPSSMSPVSPFVLYHHPVKFSSPPLPVPFVSPAYSCSPVTYPADLGATPPAAARVISETTPVAQGFGFRQLDAPSDHVRRNGATSYGLTNSKESSPRGSLMPGLQKVPQRPFVRQATPRRARPANDSADQAPDLRQAKSTSDLVYVINNYKDSSPTCSPLYCVQGLPQKPRRESAPVARIRGTTPVRFVSPTSPQRLARPVGFSVQLPVAGRAIPVTPPVVQGFDLPQFREAGPRQESAPLPGVPFVPGPVGYSVELPPHSAAVRAMPVTPVRIPVAQACNFGHANGVSNLVYSNGSKSSGTQNFKDPHGVPQRSTSVPIRLNAVYAYKQTSAYPAYAIAQPSGMGSGASGFIQKRRRGESLVAEETRFQYEEAQQKRILQKFLYDEGFSHVNGVQDVTGLFGWSKGFQYPLHAAVHANDPGMVQCLLWAGADPKLKDSADQTPLDLAYKCDYNESHRRCIEVLDKA